MAALSVWSTNIRNYMKQKRKEKEWPTLKKQEIKSTHQDSG